MGMVSLNGAELFDPAAGTEDLRSPAQLRLIPGICSRDIPHMFTRANPHGIARRVFDITFALVSLLVSAPLLLVVALLIKATSDGPVLIQQRRLTLYGREFFLLKFRTMSADAETASGPVLAEENDPRVTRLGRSLRKTRIDELPQFWNVLRGDMTVVGPRPERPEIAVDLAKSLRRFHDRLDVKAGITGLAQIENGYCATLDTYRRKLALDLLYIRKRSLVLDAVILLRTVSVVVLGKGAR